MQKKETFVEPKAEIIRFPEQDIVTTSGGENDKVSRPVGGGGGIVTPDDEW